MSCDKCNDTGWVCENHSGIEFEVCKCGGAGKPCECNKVNPPWDFKSPERKD